MGFQTMWSGQGAPRDIRSGLPLICSSIKGTNTVHACSRGSCRYTCSISERSKRWVDGHCNYYEFHLGSARLCFFRQNQSTSSIVENCIDINIMLHILLYYTYIIYIFIFLAAIHPYFQDNCTSKNLHQSSYENCPYYTQTVISKGIETKFYFGSLLHPIIIYSLTSHEITPTFYLADDDLRRSKRCSFLLASVSFWFFLHISFHTMAYSNINFGQLLHKVNKY